MNLERFVAERSRSWEELDTLVGRAGSRGDRLSAAEICHLATLYRSASADLALARRSYPSAAGTARLEGLVTRAYAVVYARPARDSTAWQFLSRGLWCTVRSNLSNVLLAASLIALAVALGAIWAAVQPATAVGVLPASFHASAHAQRGGFYGISLAARGGLAVAIFVNNIKVAAFAVAGGFTLGLITAFSLALNGLQLGVLGTLEWRAHGFDQFVRLIVPHGLLELSCIVLAGSAGIAIARALLDPGRLTRARALSALVPLVGGCLLGAMIFLVVAGVTEGVVTPWDLPTPAAVAIGVALAGTFWSLVVWRGKPPSPPTVRAGPAA